MAIGTAWADGAWVDAGWASGAWATTEPSYTTVIPCTNATGSLHDEFVQTADTETWTSHTAGQEYISQSFAAGSDPDAVAGVCVRLKRTGSPTGPFTIAIYAHTGVYGTSSEPTGSALVTSAQFDASTLTTSAANYFFPLAGWTPSASTNYTIVLDTSSVTSDSSNHVDTIYESGAEATHGGNSARSADGSTWTVLGTLDTAFKVYYRSDDFELRLRDGTYRRRLGWAAA